ncbi:MAG: hypothetical protein ACOCWL_00070 [Thermoguttaceae bacterium]
MSATPENAKTRIIFDATVLSNFARIGQFDQLQLFYADRASTTLMVVEEIHRGVEAGYSELAVVERHLKPAGWLAVTAPETSEEQSLFVTLLASLGSGEASCLATARMRNLIVATDERAARLRAAALDVRVTGTLGILVRLVQAEHLTSAQANELLTGMRLAGYYSPVQDLTPRDFM